MNILRPLRLFARAVLLLPAALLLLPLPAQAADVFDFIPLGGRTLLAKTFASRPPADEVKALLAAKHTREEWLSYLQAHSKAITGLQRLSEKELLTLADYLSYNMPLPSAQIRGGSVEGRSGTSFCRPTGATSRSKIARAATSSRSSSPRTRPSMPGWAP